MIFQIRFTLSRKMRDERGVPNLKQTDQSPQQNHVVHTLARVPQRVPRRDSLQQHNQGLPTLLQQMRQMVQG